MKRPKRNFLDTITAQEFCDTLVDFGLYSYEIDTMITQIERQGRNITHTVRLKEDQKVEGRIEYIIENKNPGYPYGVVRTTEGNPKSKPETSDKIIESLNDPHAGHNDTSWAGPFIDDGSE